MAWTYSERTESVGLTGWYFLDGDGRDGIVVGHPNPFYCLCRYRLKDGTTQIRLIDIEEMSQEGWLFFESSETLMSHIQRKQIGNVNANQ